MEDMEDIFSGMVEKILKFYEEEPENIYNAYDNLLGEFEFDILKFLERYKEIELTQPEIIVAMILGLYERGVEVHSYQIAMGKTDKSNTIEIEED